MTCSYWQRQITALVDSSLRPSQRERVESHMEGCSSCREFYTEQVKLTHMLQAAPMPVGPRPEVWHSIRQRIAQGEVEPAASRTAGWLQWLTLPQAAYAAAALFLLLGSLLVVAQREQAEVQLLAEIESFHYSASGNPFFGEPGTQDNPFFSPAENRPGNPFADNGGPSQ